jgi:hypothetical protein
MKSRKTKIFSADTVRYVIYDKGTGRELGVCASPVRKDNLDKAAKCAKFEKYRVFVSRSGYVPVLPSQLPFAGDLYISKAVVASSPSKRTRVFTTCDTTSTAPVRAAGRMTGSYPVAKPESAKTRLVKEIKDLKLLYDDAVEISRELSRFINSLDGKIRSLMTRAKKI